MKIDISIKICFIFAFMAFVFFKESFRSLEDNRALCTTPITCFAFISSWGFRAEGGVADHLTPFWAAAEDREDTTAQFLVEVGRWIYDMLFYLIVSMITLKVVTGLFVDGFGSDREEQMKKREKGTQDAELR